VIVRVSPQPVFCGLGAVDWGAALTAGAASGATTAVRSDKVTGAFVGAGSTIMALAPATGPAAPFVAAAGAIVSTMGQFFKGCGQTCVLASEAANKHGEAIQQIKSAYWALPTPRPRSAQLAALAAIDQVNQMLYQTCSDPGLADAGKRCISERLVEGGTAPWCPTPTHTGCDTITTVRNPIANDPNVYDDSAAGQVQQVLDQATKGPGGALPLLGIGLVVAGVLL